MRLPNCHPEKNYEEEHNNSECTRDVISLVFIDSPHKIIPRRHYCEASTEQFGSRLPEIYYRGLQTEFPDDTACLNHLFYARWPGGITTCESKKCGNVEHRHHRVSGRMSFACDHCGNCETNTLQRDMLQSSEAQDIGLCKIKK